MNCIKYFSDTLISTCSNFETIFCIDKICSLTPKVPSYFMLDRRLISDAPTALSVTLNYSFTVSKRSFAFSIVPRDLLIPLEIEFKIILVATLLALVHFSNFVVSSLDISFVGVRGLGSSKTISKSKKVMAIISMSIHSRKFDPSKVGMFLNIESAAIDLVTENKQ